MKKIWIVALVIIGSLLIGGGWIVSTSNHLVTLDEEVQEKWAQVENVYQRRQDLIPNLVNTVKGYAKHEKEIFENLAEKPELREAARQEIRRRVSDYEPQPDFDRGRLQRVYRTLALEHHPDHGGDNDVMAGINLFYEAISQ